MEVLIRIPGPDGHIWNAEVFMPMAAQLGLATELDQLVLTQVLTHFSVAGFHLSRQGYYPAASSKVSAMPSAGTSRR